MEQQQQDLEEHLLCKSDVPKKFWGVQLDKIFIISLDILKFPFNIYFCITRGDMPAKNNTLKIFDFIPAWLKLHFGQNLA